MLVKWLARREENVQVFTRINYCQNLSRGIYCVTSLAPLLEVRQAEIEAGDCEGRLPLLFYSLVSGPVSGQLLEYLTM